MDKKCARPNCGGNLVQLRDIYYCRCGWAGEVSIGDCDCHPGKPLLMRIRDHKYECSVCHRTTIIFRKCPECGERLTPNNVLDSAQSFVKSLSVIDLLDEKMDSFLSDEQDGAEIITANYLSLLSNEEFIKTVKYGRENQKEFQQITYEKMLQEFISQGIPEEYAKTAAESMVKTKDNDPVEKAIKKTTGYITDTSKLDQFAEAVLEYNTIKNSEDVLLLSDAVARSRELNTHPNPDIYFEIARKYGFSLCKQVIKFHLFNVLMDIHANLLTRLLRQKAVLWYWWVFLTKHRRRKQYMLRNYVLKAFYLNLIMLRF